MYKPYILILPLLLSFSAKSAEENWQHFNCQLTGFKHYVDGGIYDKKKSSILDKLENEISELKVSIRFSEKEVRVHKLLGRQSHQMNETVNLRQEKNKLIAITNDTKEVVSSWYASAKSLVSNEDKEEDNKITLKNDIATYLDYVWEVTPVFDSVGRERNLVLGFTIDEKTKNKAKPELHDIKLAYTLKTPKIESDLNGDEVKINNYECD